VQRAYSERLDNTERFEFSHGAANGTMPPTGRPFLNRWQSSALPLMNYFSPSSASSRLSVLSLALHLSLSISPCLVAFQACLLAVRFLLMRHLLPFLLFLFPYFF
jgi:hypothetical protein